MTYSTDFTELLVLGAIVLAAIATLGFLFGRWSAPPRVIERYVERGAGGRFVKNK